MAEHGVAERKESANPLKLRSSTCTRYSLDALRHRKLSRDSNTTNTHFHHGGDNEAPPGRLHSSQSASLGACTRGRSAPGLCAGR